MPKMIAAKLEPAAISDQQDTLLYLSSMRACKNFREPSSILLQCRQRLRSGTLCQSERPDHCTTALLSADFKIVYAPGLCPKLAWGTSFEGIDIPFPRTIRDVLIAD
jgi:hypothetical protein